MIFVDTSFWVAFRNSRDDRHAEAMGAFQDREGEPLLTTNLVRGETWTVLRRRAGHASARDFLDGLERSPRMKIVFVSQALERAALTWLRRRDEREYSFVDATSFEVMRSLHLRDALTFDADFVAAGFRTIP